MKFVVLSCASSLLLCQNLYLPFRVQSCLVLRHAISSTKRIIMMLSFIYRALLKTIFPVKSFTNTIISLISPLWTQFVPFIILLPRTFTIGMCFIYIYLPNIGFAITILRTFSEFQIKFSNREFFSFVQGL